MTEAPSEAPPNATPTPQKPSTKHLSTPHLTSPAYHITNLNLYKSSSIAETEHYISSILAKKYAPYIDIDSFIKLPYEKQFRIMQRILERYRGENAMGEGIGDDAIDLDAVRESATGEEGSGSSEGRTDALNRVIRSKL